MTQTALAMLSNLFVKFDDIDNDRRVLLKARSPELVRSCQWKKQRSQVGKLTGTAFWRSSVIENLQKFTQKLNFLEFGERYTLGMTVLRRENSMLRLSQK